MFSSLPATGATSGSTGFGFGLTKPSQPLQGFGSSTTPAPSAFGSTATATPSFGFGSPAAKPSFGFGTPSNPASSSSGAPTSSLSGGTGFGFGAPASTAPSAFGLATQPAASQSFGLQPAASTTLNNFQQNTNLSAAQAAGSPIAQALQKIQAAYAPYQDASGRFVSATQPNQPVRRNEDCKFKAVYMAPRESAGQQGQATSLLVHPLFEQAEKLNVDPERYVMVEEAGAQALQNHFQGLLTSLEQAQAQANRVSEILEKAHESQQELGRRVEVLALRQRGLLQGVLQAMRRLEVLRGHGIPLQASEARRVPREAARIAGATLQDRAEDAFEETIAEEDLEMLVQALQRQAEGLDGLAQTLRRDLRDVALVQNKLLPSSH
eukprot:scaffold6663_cov253-Ochromonas_danica.AAC.3